MAHWRWMKASFATGDAASAGRPMRRSSSPSREELGAGKTTLVQAICEGYGVATEVTSPTFALVHEYSAPRSPVQHLDLYRLDTPTQLDALGWDEIVFGRDLVLIEWPERAGDRIPAGHVTLSLQHLPDDSGRRLLYAGWRK
jgi:ATPase, YjeE family